MLKEISQLLFQEYKKCILEELNLIRLMNTLIKVNLLITFKQEKRTVEI